MQLRLFHFEDSYLLKPRLDPDIFQERVSALSKEILSCFRGDTRAKEVFVSEIQLESIASWYCDKWILNVEQHMSSYMNVGQMPPLREPGIPADVPGTDFVKYKSFSGDASGVIGEALFAYLLIEYFRVPDDHFAHFQASKTTGLYPDFGIHKPSETLRQAFGDQCGLGAEHFSPHTLIPAEVKSMTSPNSSIIKERLGKAAQQIRHFWIRRYREIKTQNRGASIIFLALRNEHRRAYDGVLLWMK